MLSTWLFNTGASSEWFIEQQDLLGAPMKALALVQGAVEWELEAKEKGIDLTALI